MRVFYRVVFHFDLYVRSEEFTVIFEALDFIKEIRQKGGYARLERFIRS